LRVRAVDRDGLAVLDVASVAERARGENFPVASLAFPRELRPHIRALYAYARLVDILGDELEGGPEARLAALDELEGEVDAAYAGTPTWPVLVELQPTIREFDLPREPFARLIEANRIDQRVSEYETWDDVKHYCVHSADPCGRLVLGVLRRLDDREAVGLSDDVCTGLQLVNFVQDVPRDLALGRIYLPAEDRRRFGVETVDEPIGLKWPPEVFSLSHVALPFPEDDPVYGSLATDSPTAPVALGLLSPRGEKSVLTVPVEVLMRVSANPFFPYLAKRVSDWVAVPPRH
jgi:hypothetical protein